ncbi:MAG: lipid-A-disaccharide synthase [Candidatus Manganitrophus sp.]|nr:lipid-A-disaccharide synthase [Candidatus Manganitrophus sp.]
MMIVAGEASGDLHGGALAEALLKKDPSLEMVGFGGSAMRRAGVEILFDVSRLGVVGIFEVLLHLKSVWEAYRFAVQTLKRGVDLLVLIDYPDFNLRLAKAAKRLGIPVIYYISPQIWAWRSGRIKTIAERIDLMLVLFPFEKEIYSKAGVPCEFVGHPLVDEAASVRLKYPSKTAYLEGVGFSPSGTTVGILPGSRRREVSMLLPEMLQAMVSLSKEFPNLQVLIPVAPFPFKGVDRRAGAALCRSHPMCRGGIPGGLESLGGGRRRLRDRNIADGVGPDADGDRLQGLTPDVLDRAAAGSPQIVWSGQYRGRRADCPGAASRRGDGRADPIGGRPPAQGRGSP